MPSGVHFCLLVNMSFRMSFADYIPQIHKLGRHLVVGDVLVYAASDPMFEKPVAAASLTYSIPPKRETS